MHFIALRIVATLLFAFSVLVPLQAQTMDPDRALAAAKVAIADGNYVEAERFLESAAAARPSSVVIRIIQARLMVELRRFDRAQEKIAEAESLDPQSDERLALAELQAELDYRISAREHEKPTGIVPNLGKVTVAEPVVCTNAGGLNLGKLTTLATTCVGFSFEPVSSNVATGEFEIMAVGRGSAGTTTNPTTFQGAGNYFWVKPGSDGEHRLRWYDAAGRLVASKVLSFVRSTDGVLSRLDELRGRWQLIKPTDTSERRDYSTKVTLLIAGEKGNELVFEKGSGCKWKSISTNEWLSSKQKEARVPYSFSIHPFDETTAYASDMVVPNHVIDCSSCSVEGHSQQMNLVLRTDELATKRLIVEFPQYSGFRGPSEAGGFSCWSGRRLYFTRVGR